MSDSHNAKIGKVSIPIFAIIAAIPAAVRAASDQAKTDKEADSPGGEKVTAGEVLLVIGAFLGALGEKIAPAIMSANGIG